MKVKKKKKKIEKQINNARKSYMTSWLICWPFKIHSHIENSNFPCKDIEGSDKVTIVSDVRRSYKNFFSSDYSRGLLHGLGRYRQVEAGDLDGKKEGTGGGVEEAWTVASATRRLH